MDHRLGRFLSKNLAGYLVPVNADVPDIDASFVEEHDPIASPIGARGIGELAATGMARPSPTPCSTRPGFACGSCRSGPRC